MEQVQCKRVRFFPYRYARHLLQFRPPNVCADNSRVPASAYDETQRVISIDTAENWDTLYVSLQTEIPDEVYERVLPSVERAEPPVELLLVVQCEDTLIRYAEKCPLARGMTEGYISVAIPRDDVRGTIKIEPILCRSRDGNDSLYATRRHTRVADGRPWYIRIDKKPGPPGKFLDVRWDSFTSRQDLPDPKTYYHLGLAEHPKLWLNSDFEELHELLHSEGTVGRNARIRDVIFDRIGYGVWTQLFLNALNAAGDTGEPPFAWQQAVLSHLVPYLQDDENLLEETIGLFLRFKSEPATVLQELDHVLQLKQKEGQSWKALVQEV